jgi:hypothetical protein
MPNCDDVMTDHDFLDQEPHDALAFGDIERLDILAQPSKKC